MLEIVQQAIHPTEAGQPAKLTPAEKEQFEKMVTDAEKEVLDARRPDTTDIDRHLYNWLPRSLTTGTKRGILYTGIGVTVLGVISAFTGSVWESIKKIVKWGLIGTGIYTIYKWLTGGTASGAETGSPAPTDTNPAEPEGKPEAGSDSGGTKTPEKKPTPDTPPPSKPTDLRKPPEGLDHNRNLVGQRLTIDGTPISVERRGDTSILVVDGKRYRPVFSIDQILRADLDALYPGQNRRTDISLPVGKYLTTIARSPEGGLVVSGEMKGGEIIGIILANSMNNRTFARAAWEKFRRYLREKSMDQTAFSGMSFSGSGTITVDQLATIVGQLKESNGVGVSEVPIEYEREITDPATGAKRKERKTITLSFLPA
jgi:hypothetical protein